MLNKHLLVSLDTVIVNTLYLVVFFVGDNIL